MDAYAKARATAMILGYDARWDTQDYETIGVEIEYTANLEHPVTGEVSSVFRRGGRIDALARKLRDVYVVEHKSSSEDLSPGSRYWSRLAMDGQISGYIIGARALGYDPVACLYDVLGKPRIKPLRATTETPAQHLERAARTVSAAPGAYYCRAEIVRLQSEIDAAALDDWQTAHQMAECTRLDHHPRNPEACGRFGRECPFFDVCLGRASLEPPAFRQKDRSGPQIYSASRAKTFRACPRMHYYEYVLGWRPSREAPELEFGTAIHAALEAWWIGAPGTRVEAALIALDTHKPEM